MNDNILNESIIIKPINFYNNFKNSEKLPLTPIFSFIEHQYTDFLSDINNNLLLTDIFQLPPLTNNLLPNKGALKIYNIPNKSTFSLEKFISYLIYLKSSYLLETNGNNYQLNIPGLKSQIGKDASRLDLYINNKITKFTTMFGGDQTPELLNDFSNTNSNELNNQFFDINLEDDNIEETIQQNTKLLEENYDKITDQYYEKLMDEMTKGNEEKLINFNILNEIGILSCQNIFNFIAELIQIELKKITQFILKDNTLLISPSSHEDANGKETISVPKSLQIEIENNINKVKINFDSYLFLSSDFTAVGRICFSLSINLELNTYQLDKLEINYNLENQVIKPKYTMAQTARYYGITKPTRYIKKRIFTNKGGKTKKTKKTKKTRKNEKNKKK